MVDLTNEETRAIVRALRRPIGRYSYERASQLSGVPTRTLHHWARERIFVPDFNGDVPKGWSYRDLVLVRLLVWLRSNGVRPKPAAERVLEVREGLANRTLDPLVPLRAAGTGLFIDGEDVDRRTGEQLLPDMVHVLNMFDLVEPLDDVGHMWGPSLVRPTPWTAISPAVIAGEPTVLGTRVPTATLFALVEEQQLSVPEIAVLYENVSETSVSDAVGLEVRMRQRDAAAA